MIPDRPAIIFVGLTPADMYHDFVRVSDLTEVAHLALQLQQDIAASQVAGTREIPYGQKFGRSEEEEIPKAQGQPQNLTIQEDGTFHLLSDPLQELRRDRCPSFRKLVSLFESREGQLDPWLALEWVTKANRHVGGF